MARDIVGFIVQMQRATIRASGDVSEPVCKTDPTCCTVPVDSGNAAVGCCTDPAPVSLGIEVAGPLGLGGDDLAFSGDLELVAGQSSWAVGPLPGTDGPGAEDAVFEAILYCLEGWWLEGYVIDANGVAFQFQISLLDDGESLLGEIDVPGVGVVDIMIQQPCPGGLLVECVDKPLTCGPCETPQISSRYIVRDETAIELDKVYLLAGGTCRFRSIGADWWLEYDADAEVWRLSNADGRTWESDAWSCCETNTMASQGEWPDYSLEPVYDCCPPTRYNCGDVECVEAVDGVYATLEDCLAGCSEGTIATTCCEETLLPAALTATFGGGTGDYTALNGTSITLTYASVSPYSGSPPDGWYGETTFAGKTHWFGLCCTDGGGGTWNWTIYGETDPGSACALGEFVTLVSCSPLNLTATLEWSCNTGSVGVTIT